VNLEKLQAFCRSLPGVAEDVKWGHDLCFTIDAKMFAVFGIDASNVGFKCDPERFLELTDQAGIIPAPYLARAHWVLVEQPKALTDAQAKALVRRSYELIVGKLSQRRQRELLG
jgi:predicted DNA-binding protein (MmcQ/YjbR family)